MMTLVSMTLAFVLANPCFAANTLQLNFTVKGARSNAGSILISLFKSADGFPDQAEKAVKIKKVKATQGDIRVSMDQLPAGEYAIAFIHDENDNGKLDTSMIGIPKEGIGFSKDPRLTFGAPSFGQAKFILDAGHTSQTANLKYY